MHLNAAATIHAVDMAFPRSWALAGLSGGVLCFLMNAPARAQDLVPRAYVVSPVGANAITISSSYFVGPVAVDPTLPITGFTARFDIAALSYTRSFSFFGRSSNVVASIPYVVGTFQATVIGQERNEYRSGLADARLRFSVNLKGGPATHASEFRKWREKFVLGASLTVTAPIGQYDPARVINPGLNRWAFKPELGLSRRWGAWALDLYGGVWFFTANDSFYPGLNTRTQSAVATAEVHLNYILRPRLWASLDGNFWTGGTTAINGTPNHDLQRESRVGGTVSVPISQHQSLKFSFSTGAYISIGGNYKNFSTAWQYTWLSGPK